MKFKTKIALKPIRHQRRKWWLMSIAKRTGGWDIWLGNKFGMDFEEKSIVADAHWHLKQIPFVVYRKEY